MSDAFTNYPRPMRATPVVSVSFANQQFCMAVVVARRGPPRFCGEGGFNDLYPCGVCGRHFCEAHAGDGTITLPDGDYLLCYACSQLSYDEQMRVIALRKDFEHG